MRKLKISKTHIYIIVIMLIGLGVRLACCFWGYPFRLHPDEGSVVANTIDMLARQSWEANVYSRPDQFEIKSCAFLFQILSRVLYHMSAVEAWTDHQITFYIIARVYTTVLGTAMIPTAAILIYYLFRNAEINIQRVQILSALLIAFSPTLTLHSSYATPDIPLAFLTMLFGVFFVRYIQDGKMTDMILSGIVVGLAVSTKWPGAILCIFIAVMIIFRAVKERKISHIFLYGCLSIILVLSILFVMAPNLFTNIGQTVRDISNEARSEHLGADGLGVFGNIMFYLKIMLQNTGILAIIPSCVGIYWLVKKRRAEYLVIAIGGVWWICMSILSLHWIRWCVPAYGIYFILVAIGITVMSTWLTKVRYIAWVVLGVILGNMCILTLAQTKNVLSTDSRIVAYDYCMANGMTAENSVSEGYTPFTMPFPFSIWREFQKEDGKLTLTSEEYKDCKYLLVGSHYWYLYEENTEKYEEPLQVYDNLENNYKLIYYLKADNIYEGDSDNRDYSIWEIKNIIKSIKYLIRPVTATGFDIYIYDMEK